MTEENELPITIERVGMTPQDEIPQMREFNFSPVEENTEEPPTTAEAPVVEVIPEPAPISSEFKPEAIFGEEYDSVDKVKEVLTSAKELKQKLAEYESKLKDSEIKDPYIKSLSDWTKQGKSKDTHDLVYYSDPSKLDLAQKVALQLQIESGLSPEKAAKIVNYKYKLGEDYDETDPEVDVARTMLEVDAKAAHDKIEQFRAKESAPVPSFDYAAQVKSWDSNIQTTMGSLKEIEISKDMKYPVPQATLDAAKQHIESVLLSDGVEMDVKDPKQHEVVMGIARDFIKARELDNILKYSQTEWEKKQIREKSNIPAVESTAPKVTKPGPDDWMKTAQPFRL